jgi:hypothetical protein
VSGSPLVLVASSQIGQRSSLGVSTYLPWPRPTLRREAREHAEICPAAALLVFLAA